MHLRPLICRFLTAPIHALFKRDHWRRNLLIRTLATMTKVQSSRPSPLMFRFLTASVHALPLS
ncbi:hypothetical protein EFT52_01860 [Lacticaseibacillus paracasei]|nr:hypothetical protein [Lacticaseibacillus paracasei]